MTMKDFGILFELLEKEIYQMEQWEEYPPIYEKPLTEIEINERKKKLKESNRYKDLLETRENFKHVYVNVDIKD